VLWRAAIGAGYAGPAVANGRVYLMDRVPPAVQAGVATNDTAQRAGAAGRERVLCLDAASGDLLWQYAYDCSYTIAYGSGPRVTPTVTGGKVYALGAMGRLLCLDAANGAVRWQCDFVKDHGARVPVWGYAAHPLVDGGRVITLVGGAGQTVMAFDAETGAVVWKSLTAREPGYCAPMIYTLAGARQLVVWHPDALCGLQPATGTPLWSVPFPVGSGMSITPPAVSGNRLLVSGQFSGALMVEIGADGAPRELWRASNGGKPERPWATKGFNNVMGTIFLRDGYAYSASTYGEFCCAKAATGARVWTTVEPIARLTEPKDKWATAFITPNGDRQFMFTEKGDLAIVQLAPDGYRELDRAHVIEPTTPASGAGSRLVVWSHPAYANRCMFVRNDRELICISLAAASAPPRALPAAGRTQDDVILGPEQP